MKVNLKIGFLANYVLLALFLLFTIKISAQNTTIKGIVTDENNTPLIGVNVVQKGTTNGTITDMDGNYQLSVPSDAILVFSYVGYITQEIPRNGLDILNVRMREHSEILNEVVIIGYGSAKKIDLSGSVASVGGEKLSPIRATSVPQALQGLMPGVQVTRTNSMPGADATIRVRGITTIGNSDPLVIIDGIPGDLFTLNVDDIESISVLKDAASASIYGARAAAGVILVTTKRAKEGVMNIEYSGTTGFVAITAFPGTVNYKRYMEMINEIAWNDGGNIEGNEYSVYSKDFIENYAENHKKNPNQYPLADWKSYLINNTAPNMKHDVSLNFGSKSIKSMTTFGYESTDALYDNCNHSNITVRTNNDLKLNDVLSVTVDGSYRRGISKNPVVNPLRAAYLYAPLWSPVWADGRISGGRDGTNTYARLKYGGFDNSWNDYLTGRFSLIYTPLKNLTITGVYAPTIKLNKNKNFIKQIPYYDADDPTLLVGYISGKHWTNSLSEMRNERRTTTKQLFVNYSATFWKKHDLSVLAGYEDYGNFYEVLQASSDEMELSEFPYLDRGNLSMMSNSGNASENAYCSWFGRGSYNFENRYLLQANVRFDKSSRFHKDYRLGIFPSISMGWIISEEQFFKNLKFEPLSFLKARGSWGKLGNERIGDYAYQSIMNFSNALFIENGEVVSKTTASQRDYNITDITWESTETFNIGLDIGFFNNKLLLGADFYKKKTRDMLLKVQIPVFMGYNNPNQNAGMMHTKGWDLQVDWRDRIDNLTYSLSFNLSDYKSVMGNLSGTVFEGDKRIMEGGQYEEWYGYKSDGLFLTQADRDNSPVTYSSVKVGDIKYVDISGPDGIPDGIISPQYDRVLLGGSLPRYLYGGNINLEYKKIDFGLTFQGVGEQNARLTRDMVWQESAWHTFPDYMDGNYFSHYNTAEKNAKVKFPRLSQIAQEGNNFLMSDFWLFDGSYFRLKNIILGYTLPKKIVDRLHMEKLRAYVIVSDLFSIDNFPKGWDPEASTQGDGYITKSFNFGLSVKF